MQAKTMHICMCIKNVLHKDPAAEKDRLLVLLDTVMLVRTHVSHNAVTLRAIRQAIPGRSPGYMCPESALFFQPCFSSSCLPCSCMSPHGHAIYSILTSCFTMRLRCLTLVWKHHVPGSRQQEQVHLTSKGRSASAPLSLRAGLLDCLSRLHKWPDGLDEKEEWLAQATQIIRDIMARHVRDARNQGITPEKHVRKALSVPG